MLLRANTLAKGNSRSELEQRLSRRRSASSAQARPCRARLVGASGDLAPLGRTSAARRRRRRLFDGERLSGADALAAAGLEPTVLEAKEGLSLVNGTQFMPRFGTPSRARRLTQVPTSPARCRWSRGRAPARTSRRRSTRGGRCAARWIPPRTSSAYSKARRSTRRTAGATRCRTRTRSVARPRCTAPPGDLLDYVDYTISVELNAATDNPLVLVEDELLVSNGPSTANSRSTRSRWRPRRTSRASRSDASSGSMTRTSPRPPRTVPDHTDGGLNSGFMIPQAAASLVSENKSLRHPRVSTRSRRAPARRITFRWATPPASRRGRCLRTPTLAIELASGRRRQSSSSGAAVLARGPHTASLRSLSPRLRDGGRLLGISRRLQFRARRVARRGGRGGGRSFR